MRSTRLTSCSQSARMACFSREPRWQTARREAQIIEHPLVKTAVGSDERPHADDTDALHLLDRFPAVFIARIDFSLREIGVAGDDRDLRAEPRPFSAMLKSALRGRVHFGGEIVGEEQDFQAIAI